MSHHTVAAGLESYEKSAFAKHGITLEELKKAYEHPEYNLKRRERHRALAQKKAQLAAPQPVPAGPAPPGVAALTQKLAASECDFT